ncbi:AbrB family transcriptional regulator [Saccharibacillus sp. CPCC 101409]|uniref:AbrB family transcriptional regulator n=1 Tax=Saccharibacillus sp. CPCC 101409 TaxID=3058041 RepID=UPI0026711773|nr:AbrB family transcriptional regulator [Saccharibacillus sp. CPCC 101409]MDO3411621.1 AbrB family transcriptional regulator [Saccharibacillus sp. CPCC 101409]
MKPSKTPRKGLWQGILAALLISLAGALIFLALGLPVPWLLGPMLASLIGSNLLRGRYAWPAKIRNGAMIVIGYTIGLALTGEALRRMGAQIPYIVLMTFLLLLLCAGIAFVIGRLSGTDFKTSLLGSVPGGLSQMVIIAEETKGADLTIVTVNQVLRLLLIIVAIPLLIYSPLFGQHSAEAAQAAVQTKVPWSGLFPNILVYAPLCVLLALLGKKVRFPTAFLLGPAFGTALLQATGFHAPALPAGLIAAAQLAMGTYVGMLLKPAQIQNKVRTLSLALLSSILLLIGSILLTVLLTRVQPVTSATALLSLAPGGMDQMGVIAHSIGAELSTVTGYQLFRTFFIFFAIPPLLRLLFRYTDKRAGADTAARRTDTAAARPVGRAGSGRLTGSEPKQAGKRE